jgi:RNA polymerase sigma-70 factor (ECF subfamily)
MTDGAPEGLQALRRAAYGAAYRMLGVHADAEEAAQEALARLHAASEAPESPRAWVVAVSTRLCIDRLRSAKARRESYVGPWLPEPLLAAPDPAEELELAESVSIALLLVLETLTPAERAAFLLHDVFGYSHGEIAATLERSEPAARQLVSRARRAVRERRVRFEPDPAERARIAGAFAAACTHGDMDALLAVLAEDVVMRSDGGGVASAARRPLVGAARVARAIVALRGNLAGTPTLTMVPLNGTPGMLIGDGERPVTLMGIDVEGGRVAAIHVVREPAKLAAALATLS